MITFPLIPVPKPRQTRSDKWRQRRCVMTYRAFADAVRYYAGLWKFPDEGAEVTFFIPMPRTWSKKDKLRLANTPHRQKPDIDNLLKALLDALCEDDSYIYSVSAKKYWAHEGRIEISTFPEAPERRVLEW